MRTLNDILTNVPSWTDLELNGKRVQNNVDWLCHLRNKMADMGEYEEWCTAISAEFLTLLTGITDEGAKAVIDQIAYLRSELTKPKDDHLH